MNRYINGTREAVTALAQYMAEKESTFNGPTFQLTDSSTEQDISESDSEPDYVTEARIQAERYVAARNRNMRGDRGPIDDSEAAKDGYKSAMDFLNRRKKSQIRK